MSYGRFKGTAPSSLPASCRVPGNPHDARRRHLRWDSRAVAIRSSSCMFSPFWSARKLRADTNPSGLSEAPIAGPTSADRLLPGSRHRACSSERVGGPPQVVSGSSGNAEARYRVFSGQAGGTACLGIIRATRRKPALQPLRGSQGWPGRPASPLERREQPAHPTPAIDVSRDEIETYAATTALTGWTS